MPTIDSTSLKKLYAPLLNSKLELGSKSHSPSRLQVPGYLIFTTLGYVLPQGHAPEVNEPHTVVNIMSILDLGRKVKDFFPSLALTGPQGGPR